MSWGSNSSPESSLAVRASCNSRWFPGAEGRCRVGAITLTPTWPSSRDRATRRTCWWVSGSQRMNTVGANPVVRSGSERTAVSEADPSATRRPAQSCSRCVRASSVDGMTTRRGSSMALAQASRGLAATTSTSDDHCAHSRLVQVLAVMPRTSGWGPESQRQRLSSRVIQTSSSPRQPNSTEVGEGLTGSSDRGCVPRRPRAVQKCSRGDGTDMERRPRGRVCRVLRRRSERPVMTPAARSPPIGPR